MSSHKEHSYCCRAFLLVDGIAWGVFLIFKTRLWLIRGVGPAWSDEETDYNYKRLLGPEQSKILTATRASLSGVSMVVKGDYVRRRLDLLGFFFFVVNYRIQMSMDVAHSITRVLASLMFSVYI